MRRRYGGWAGVPALVVAMLATVLVTPAAVAAPAAAGAGEAAATVAVADLAWMAGHWVGEMDGAVIEEHWSPPGGGVIMGMFRWLQAPEEDGAEAAVETAAANRVALYEFFAIEPGDDGRPVLRLRHFDPGLTAWETKDAPMEFRLKEAGERRVVFERQGEDGPVWLAYRSPRPGVLVAELVEGGRETEFRYARVGG